MDPIISNKSRGDFGENEVIKLIFCPNCSKKLMTLPKNFPLYDLQCTGCSFRAQVKTNLSKPKDEILGAGWDIMDKVTKSGFIVPPLVTNYRWKERGKERHEIRFYPFIPKKNLKMRVLSPTARRANYKMFNYVGLLTLSHFTLYKK